MATWIVHLRIAENLLHQIHNLDPSYFAIGNVAPDSGIPDENWGKFEPPSEILHFKNPNNVDRRLADLDFFRQHFKSPTEPVADTQQFSFLLGYFFHLVTDNLWDEQIGKPTQARFAQEFEEDPKFIWQVKRDWYGLDLAYVRNHPSSIFWTVFLGSEYQKDYLEFLPKDAVQQRLAYIKELYQRTDEKIEEVYGNRPDKYLSEPEMDDFIQIATERLYQLYAFLWLKNGQVSDLASALDLTLTE
jgi:hypothetical protein